MVIKVLARKYIVGQNIQPREKCAVGSTGGWAATSRKTGTAFRRGQASPSPTSQTKRKETKEYQTMKE